MRPAASISRPGASPPGMPTLVLLTAFATVSLNMFLPSLGAIADEFATDYATVNIAVAGYLAVTAVVQIVAGPLSDRCGRRPVTLACLALFAAASLGCLLSQDIATFLAFRMLQAAVISGSVLARAIVRDTRPAREAASLLGYVSMAMAIGPMVGPMIGGGLEELFGWRASFVFFTVAGAGMFLLCWHDLGETNTTRSETFRSQFAAYPELVRSRRFWGYSLCMAFSVGGFYAFISGAPKVAETVLDLSPGLLGICIGSITGGFAFGSFLAGRYAARVPLIAMMLAGRAVACAGLTLGLVLVLTGTVTVLSVFGTTIFVGIGNGITMPSAASGSMSVRPRLAGSASGLSGALVVAVGAGVTSVTGGLVEGATPALTLIVTMLACTALSLAAGLYVLAVDRQEAARAGQGAEDAREPAE